MNFVYCCCFFFFSFFIFYFFSWSDKFILHLHHLFSFSGFVFVFQYIADDATKLRERMVHGTKLYQIAACDPNHVGKWEGVWEECYVVKENLVEMTCSAVIVSDHAVCKNIPLRFVRPMESEEL